MSIGNAELKSKGETPPKTISNNVNFHNQNNSNHPRHYTSFKNVKPKPSKTKYLTPSEIKGIALSILLSIIISILIVYLLHKFGPIILNFVIDILNMLFYNKSSVNNNHNESKTNSLISKFILLKKDLNCTSFKNTYYQKHPVLFQSDRLNNNHINDFFISDKRFINTELDLLSIEYISENQLTNKLYLNTTAKLSFSIEEYNKFQFSINNDYLGNNYYYSDHQILINLQESMNLSLSFPGIYNHNINNNNCNTLHNHYDPFQYFTHSILSIGKNISSLSGTGFHIHKQRLNELLYGRKHWVIYKPSNIPETGFNPYENLFDWQINSYTKLKTSSNANEQPYEIIQEAGEVVYIPEGWYHATKTISELSISISYESTEDEVYGSFYYYLIEGNKKLLEKDYKGAIKFYRLGLAIQSDYHLYQQLAYVYEKDKLYHEAEEVYRQIIKYHPRNPYSYAMLINLLISYSSTDTSESIANLLQQGSNYGIRDIILKLMKNII